MNIEVRDRVNHDRLLGYLENPPALAGTTLRIAIAPPLRSATFEPQAAQQPVEIDTVTLDLAWYYEDNGYTQRSYFITHDPLKALLATPMFKLPGESLDEAAHRRELR